MIGIQCQGFVWLVCLGFGWLTEAFGSTSNTRILAGSQERLGYVLHTGTTGVQYTVGHGMRERLTLRMSLW